MLSLVPDFEGADGGGGSVGEGQRGVGEEGFNQGNWVN